MKVITTIAFVVAVFVGTASQAVAEQQRCERGEFCLWAAEFFQGAVHRVDLNTANPGDCVPLPAEMRSFANRTKRPVTVYQGGDCSTEGEFATYPGGGTYVPEAPYLVRAVQVWEH